MNRDFVRLCIFVNGCLLAIALGGLLAHGPGVHVVVSLVLAAIGIISGLIALWSGSRRFRNRSTS